MNVTYNEDLLKAINDLTIINDHVAIVKEENSTNIEIRKADEGHLVMYHLTAPVANFNINESISFYDYSRFYNKFSMFDNPTIDVDGGVLTCKSGTRVATHNLASTDVIDSDFTKISLPSVDRKFKLTAEMIKNFRDLSSSGYFDSNRLTLDFSDNSFYKCHSTKHNNTFRDDLNDVEKLTDNEFSVVLDTKVLSMIPSANYEVQVSEAGLMELDMVRTDNVSIKLYLANVAE